LHIFWGGAGLEHVIGRNAMLRDGLYRVGFQTPVGAGAGILYLAGGKLRGGDSYLYYIGTYTQRDDEFLADVTTNRHTPGFDSVFGIDRVHIKLRGTSNPASSAAQMTGSAVEAPGVIFQAILTLLSE